MHANDSLSKSQRGLAQRYAEWMSTGTFDEEQVARLHRDAIAALHELYCETIPAYHALAESMALAGPANADAVIAELFVADDFFKSYSASWVDEGDFTRMTQWLNGISSRRSDPAADADLNTIDDWIMRHRKRGISIRYSSGTSGHFSFVPRDAQSIEASTRHSLEHAAFTLHKLGVVFAQCDAYVFSFRGGGLGIASAGETLGSHTRSQTFLYDFPVSADLLRATLRNQAAPRFREAWRAFVERVVGAKEREFERMAGVLGERSRDGVALVLATPGQLLEFCRYLEAQGRRLSLHADSVLAIGGGWKSFAGAALPRAEFEALIQARLGVPASRIVESYSMIECGVSSQRCGVGRFHVPPLILPLVFQDDLRPIGGAGSGRFGFVDPFALSYPGFFVSGDQVTLAQDPCPCGVRGPTIVGEIRRGRGQEARGCAGVMAALEA